MRFVLDASASAAWLLELQATPYTDAIRARVERGDLAIAPALLHIEIANALRTAVKKQRITPGEAQAKLGDWVALPIETDTTPVDPARILGLALRHDLSSYDATYLELALRLQLPIATQDDALANAARASGVGVAN